MTAQPEASVSPERVSAPAPAEKTVTPRPALGAPWASFTAMAMNEAVVGRPRPRSGARAAVLTTGLVLRMFGHVTETVTMRVGCETSEPPSQADSPVPVMFQAEDRTTV